MKIFSNGCQSDIDLVIDYPTRRDQLRDSLTKFGTGVFGSHTKRNLAQLKVGKFSGRPLRGIHEMWMQQTLR